MIVSTTDSQGPTTSLRCQQVLYKGESCPCQNIFFFLKKRLKQATNLLPQHIWKMTYPLRIIFNLIYLHTKTLHQALHYIPFGPKYFWKKTLFSTFTANKYLGQVLVFGKLLKIIQNFYIL